MLPQKLLFILKKEKENKMRASELIRALSEEIFKNGDLPVKVRTNENKEENLGIIHTMREPLWEQPYDVATKIIIQTYRKQKGK